MTALPKEILDKFRQRTVASYKFWAKAKHYLPGGCSRNTVFYWPYPIYIRKGKGCRIYDVDGNEYVDFSNNYTSLILGHAHPAVIEALKEYSPNGTAYAAPTELEYQHAKLLRDRLPPLRMVRYANSGTEAVMYAVKAARASTRRKRIVKFEGSYHGGYDSVAVDHSAEPRLLNPGQPQKARTKVVEKSTRLIGDAFVLPYNNVEVAQEILRDHNHEIAAIIVEPIMGRIMVPANKDFLKSLREMADFYGISLIFDEVISFRVHYGGGQSFYGVVPDLTVLGKIIGGGLPIGAFGGQEDLMGAFDPSRRGGSLIEHSGTFNANPLSLATGIATLKELKEQRYERMNSFGRTLRSKLGGVFAASGFAASATGLGSLFQIHLTRREIRNYGDALLADHAKAHTLFIFLLISGFFLAPRLMGCVSTPMTYSELDGLVDTVEEGVDHISRSGT